MENVAYIAIIAASIVVSIVAVKIGISFDLNAWLKARSEHQKERLKILCPHTNLKDIGGGKWQAESYFHNPSGTMDWICSRCQFRTSDPRIPEKLMRTFAENPETYLYKLKKFTKLANKMYKL